MPGEDERFRALFDAHFADLWRFVRRRCATPEDADDIAGQVFAVAWRRRGDLPEGVEVRLWLFGVARRVLANHRRTGARHDRLVQRLSGIADGHEDREPDVPSDLLGAALASLSEDHRAVVEMRCWDGLTVGEIAAVLDCSPNAVSIRLHRARKQLAAYLARTGLASNGHVADEIAPLKEHSDDCR
jgi:RNA polymerase sigma-70 factor (ECF subfamily)